MSAREAGQEWVAGVAGDGGDDRDAAPVAPTHVAAACARIPGGPAGNHSGGDDPGGDTPGGDTPPGMPQGLAAGTRSRLWLPPMALAGCVRGVMLRDTRAAALAPGQRFNHYPATPLCSISWWFSGVTEMLEPGHPPRLDSPRRPMGARIAFAGPHTGPTVSWSDGPGHGMMLLLLPDAVQALTGLAPRDWLNRMADVREALPPPWVAWCEAVARVAEPPGPAGARQAEDRRLALVSGFLHRPWAAVRPASPLGVHRYRDWLQGLALRAATSQRGRSLRQVERRIRDWAGQPMRELQGFGRAERAFFDALRHDPAQRPPWPDIAADQGYADQSHLCRETRRLTGFAPEQLRRLIAEDEGFWAYRIWQ